MKRTRFLISILLFCYTTMAAAECTVNATPVSIGTYQPFEPAPSDSSGDIAITCLAGTPYNIKLDAGSTFTDFFPRKMHSTSATTTLDYNLYRDIARSEVWGDGMANTYTVSGTGTGSTTILRIYGRVPAGQPVAPGTYTDAVSILVEW